MTVNISILDVTLKTANKTTIRIWIEKVMLVLHIRSLGEDTLGRKIYEKHIKNNWPGLARECEIICKELNLPNITKQYISKTEIIDLSAKR